VKGVRKIAGIADNLAGSETGTFRTGSWIDIIDGTFHTDQCIPFITVLWVEWNELNLLGRNEMNKNEALILGLSPTSSAKVSLSLCTQKQ
jgi:hypothetical protein